MKRAALFSALTGLRHCDIQKLKWQEIQKDGDQIRLNFTQQKTKGVEYMPISEQAYQLCGEPRKPEQLVFEDLPNPQWISLSCSSSLLGKQQISLCYICCLLSLSSSVQNLLKIG